MAFRQDRYVRGLYQPGRDLTLTEPGLYEIPDLTETEPGLYAFDAVAYAIGYVTVTPYNAEVA